MRDRNLFLSSSWVQPSGALIWMGAALVLIILGILFPQVTSSIRTSIVDFFTPLLQVAAQPAGMAQGLKGEINDLAHLRSENAKLREEVESLKAWVTAAQQLKEENGLLRGLTKYKDEAVLSYLTAHVIAESGSSFSDNVIITAGARDGVEKDMVALDEDGVVGRVMEAGDWSARILLLNDLNSRLPVMVAETKSPAILAGQGRNPLKLLYLAKEPAVKPGMRVVTSGFGGIFPVGLPVGVVKDVQGEEVSVQPYGHFDHLEMVRLARYRLAPSLTETPQTPAPITAPSQAP